MLRDTFAVQLLLAGVPLDQVSLLLGHSSIKITEKHYAPFVKARQQQLEIKRTHGLGEPSTVADKHGSCDVNWEPRDLKLKALVPTRTSVLPRLSIILPL